jgi:predicted RNA-binding Zn-ribbon protein involved in translation (DUF1610 family)
VTDLERFFHLLVRNLAATDPARLRQPLALADLRESLLPYRANRRPLQLESSEDYELVLLRFCAGEGGFARIEPDEVRAEFEAEARSSNPDLTIVERHGKAVIWLEASSVERSLDPEPHRAYAPPEEFRKVRKEHAPLGTRAESSPAREKKSVPHPGQATGTSSPCPSCGAVLPDDRVVNFCPKCGCDLKRARCTKCKAELEPGWRHCVGCGAAVPRP